MCLTLERDSEEISECESCSSTTYSWQSWELHVKGGTQRARTYCNQFQTPKKQSRTRIRKLKKASVNSYIVSRSTILSWQFQYIFRSFQLCVWHWNEIRKRFLSVNPAPQWNIRGRAESYTWREVHREHVLTAINFKHQKSKVARGSENQRKQV